ncbi:NrfD/PsrC family molybdoenzyme membrane anchor subunit [Aliidiomarina haloalkalitolerans]|uniref:Tetrathionate reductase n=1 Tax=Aliidiomarina haloalkalitolerans TaxID=859059 RepID=A0A432VTM9_9GAMM|nr:NrfD/PsrC family molybdoenzyme membrane anchor subunit [Aliidiomarina haloalkalitolerans]RUO19828.1 tetrathionate reductase [Aliidiomarina haloalkalitolerans]
MNSSIIEILTPRYELAWYPWAVQYFFLIAISYSALLLSLPGTIGRGQLAQRWQPMARLALLITLTCTLVAPVALLADLHQPMRFWHFYTNATPTSWMSIGSILLPLYLISVLAYVWLAWRPALQKARAGSGFRPSIAKVLSFGDWQASRAILTTVALVATLFAFGIMLYTGAEIAIIKARPLWHTNWLPIMFVTTGMVAAAGLVILLNRWMSPEREGREDINRQGLKVILIAMLISALVATAWFVSGFSGHSDSVAAALQSIQANSDWRLSAIWALVAGVTLFVLAGLALKAGNQARSVLNWAWIVGLLALHVGWAFRWMVLMEVQTVAKNTAGYYQLVVELGSYGLMGIIGTFGLWLAALLLIDLFIPWQGKAQLEAQHG